MADVKVEEGSLRSYYYKLKLSHDVVFEKAKLSHSIDIGMVEDVEKAKKILNLLDEPHISDDLLKQLYYIIHYIVCPNCLNIIDLNGSFSWECPGCKERYNEIKFNSNDTFEKKYINSEYRNFISASLYEMCKNCFLAINSISCPECNGEINLNKKCSHIITNADLEVTSV